VERMKRLLLILGMLIFLAGLSYGQSVPAFPGAEGFGAFSVGGRGGQVIKVTNLNDDGPGSLRSAVEATGPRIVIFEVSGIINLESTLVIGNPYITIAGQTSPEGITVTGYQTTVNAHDVIIQHMRFRVGSHKVPDGADPETLDSFDILGNYWAPNEAYNIMIDHCSFSWGVDETVTISGGVQNVTIQWSIISEGLSQAGHPKGQHSKGLLVSGKYEYPNTVSIHHNYIAHNTDRNPMISSPEDVDTFADVVNNVVYDWYGCLPMISYNYARANWINNYAKSGPESNEFCYEFHHYPDGCSERNDHPDCQSPIPLYYLEGNTGQKRTSQDQGEWEAAGYIYYDLPLDEGFRKMTPWSAPQVRATEMSYDYALEILDDVGANKPVRDEIDSRVITDFDFGTGRIVDDMDELSIINSDESFPLDRFPAFTDTLALADSDDDGIADLWEEARELDTEVDDSVLDDDSDGYTNIEEYLHYLGGYKESDCIHLADLDPCDGEISISELMLYINRWLRGRITSEYLMEAIAVWKG